MSRFTSRRERRLWLWALAAVVAIYSTLGVAQTLAGAFRERGLLAVVYSAGMLLVLIALATQGLKVRPRGFELGVASGIVAVYLFAFVRIFSLEHRGHLIEYSIVALLIHEALIERSVNGRGSGRPALLAILLTTAVGSLDEGIQLLLPNRAFDPFDLLFNLLATFMAVTANATLGWVRRRRARS